MESIRDRARSEGGFTLIELLVVMIIISILMAVAVPKFLSQKNNALKTQATGDIKQVINAMESCAVAITQGGYSDASMDCSTASTLTTQEASLGQLNITASALSAGQVDKTQVALTASKQGFIVERVINDSGNSIFFAEIHTDAGQIYKLCSKTPIGIADTSSSAEPTSKTCKKNGSAAAPAW
jgi:prepilin-type N-terminal cleavage/methylation domain-containing protein